MQYVILGSLVLVSLMKKKSKAAYALLFCFCIYLCAFCTESFDLINLQNMFEYPDIYHENVAFGWDWFFNFCIKSGMSYTLFKAICAAITLTINTIIIKRSTKNSSFVLSIFAVCLFIIQITQIRNSMAAAFAMLAFSFLIDGNRKGTIKYLICMILAISLHYSTVFYLLFLLIKLKIPDKKFLNLTLMMLLIISVLAFSNILYSVAVELFPNATRITSYLDMSGVISSIDSHSIKTIIILILEHLILYCIFRYSYNAVLRDAVDLDEQALKTNKLYGKNQQLSILKMQYILFLLLPFYLVSPTFIRIFKNAMLFIYLMAANAVTISELHNGACRGKRKMIVFLTFISALGLWLLDAYMQGEGFITLNSLEGIFASWVK